MFAYRIRNVALALAGAALIATSLTSSVAAAGPAGSQPWSAAAETVAAKPKVDLPRADGEIFFVNYSVTGAPHNRHTWFTYVIENNGPERAAFKYEMYVTYLECATCTSQIHTLDGHLTLDSGARENLMIAGFCEPNEPGNPCLGSGAKITTLGLDPNQSNNTVHAGW
jgi:hypothetical protein